MHMGRVQDQRQRAYAIPPHHNMHGSRVDHNACPCWVWLGTQTASLKGMLHNSNRQLVAARAKVASLTAANRDLHNAIEDRVEVGSVAGARTYSW